MDTCFGHGEVLPPLDLIPPLSPRFFFFVSQDTSKLGFSFPYLATLIEDMVPLDQNLGPRTKADVLGREQLAKRQLSVIR